MRRSRKSKSKGKAQMSKGKSVKIIQVPIDNVLLGAVNRLAKVRRTTRAALISEALRFRANQSNQSMVRTDESCGKWADRRAGGKT